MENKTQKSKKEYWKEQIARYRKSGQSIRQYCLTENLSYWTFRDWLKKIKTDVDQKLVKIPKQVHLPLDKKDLQSSIEIIIAEKISIRVGQGFDGVLLRDVVRELGIQL